jgi:hypothetical protein
MPLEEGCTGGGRADFAVVKEYGVERWLGELVLALREERYRPDTRSGDVGAGLIHSRTRLHPRRATPTLRQAYETEELVIQAIQLTPVG